MIKISLLEMKGVIFDALQSKENFNLLFVGAPGVGKSTIVKQILDTEKCSYSYRSLSLLNGFYDYTIEDGSVKQILLFEDEEVLVFDEITRVQPELLSQLYELLVFRTINGQKIKAKVVIMLANDGDKTALKLTQLDSAFLDRIDIYYVQPSKDEVVEYFKEKYGLRTSVEKLYENGYSPRGIERLIRQAIHIKSITSPELELIRTEINSIKKEKER